MTIKRIAQLSSAAVLVLVAITGLGPANWQPRTELGWQFDHFVGYFVITLFVCFAWPRPVAVALVLTVFSMVLEGLQALTVDRWPNFQAALYGAGGVLVAALLAELFIRARRRGAG